jgi:hypothetical protein
MASDPSLRLPRISDVGCNLQLLSTFLSDVVYIIDVFFIVFSVVDKVRRDGGYMAGRCVGTLRHFIRVGGIISELTLDPSLRLT